MGYEDATIALAKRYKKENDRLRAELASRQIDIDTFREGNQKLRAELANARLERDNIALLNSSLIAELAEVKTYVNELHGCLSAMTDRWEPDTEGLDRVMWENAQEALGRDIWDRLKTT